MGDILLSADLWTVFEGTCMYCECHFMVTKPVFTGKQPYYCPECKEETPLSIVRIGT